MASAAAAIAVVAALISAEPALAFGVGPASRGSIGNVKNQRGASSSASFVRAGSKRSTGESSSTSLSSSYVVKPEMARSRTSEWRKLRTRGPGFGEKVCVACALFFCLFFVANSSGSGSFLAFLFPFVPLLRVLLLSLGLVGVVL